MHTLKETALGAYAHFMLDQSPVAMALVATDELQLLAANPSFQPFLEQKWQPGQSIGRRLGEILIPTAQVEIASLMRSVIQTGVACYRQAYKTFSSTDGVRYWNLALSSLEEHDHVQYVLFTAFEVTVEVLAQTHQAVEREQYYVESMKTILLNLQQDAEPKTVAQEVTLHLEHCFSPHVIALYSAPATQETLALLALHTHSLLLSEPVKLPASISAHRRHLPPQVLRQRTPFVLRRQESSQETQQWFLSPETQCVIFLPLWQQRCEGLLVLAFSTEEAVTPSLLYALSECASHVAGALASAWRHAALVDEEQRLHTILDQLPEGVLLVEARTGRVSYTNPAAAALLGFSIPTLLGTPLNQSALLSPYGLSKEKQQSVFRWNFALIDALWGRTSTHQELLITRPDGSELVVLSAAAPIRESHGFIREAVIIFQDITASKHLEQQRNAFFASANHELRTPLTIMMGFAEILEHRAKQQTDVRFQHALTRIREEGEHLLRLVHDLLDVSRMEQARLEVQPTLQDLLIPLREMVHKQIAQTNPHHISFKVQDLKAEEALFGWFDLLRIEQIMRNLISNAVRYSPVGSTIEVGVCPRRDSEGIAQEVLFWVKDQGIGIAPEDLPHLFERFYRAGNNDNAISGFGIGLYLTRELVKGHSGYIWAESTKGEGSTFFVALPLAPKHQ